jgi:ABC-type sugar transport system substrate-binding protein
VLARREWALLQSAPRRARICATAVVGPGQLAAAIARVLRKAEVRPDVVFVAFDGTDAGRARIDAALAANGLSGVPSVDPMCPQSWYR